MGVSRGVTVSWVLLLPVRYCLAVGRNCGKEALQGSWGAVVDVISGESVFFVAAFAFGEFGMGDSPQLRPAGQGKTLCGNEEDGNLVV